MSKNREYIMLPTEASPRADSLILARPPLFMPSTSPWMYSHNYKIPK